MSLEDKFEEEIVEIVAGIAEEDPAKVSRDARLEDLGIDSLDGLRIVAAVEKRYKIVIEEDEIAKIRTMPDIFDMVRRYAAEADTR